MPFVAPKYGLVTGKALLARFATASLCVKTAFSSDLQNTLCLKIGLSDVVFEVFVVLGKVYCQSRDE